jgi:glycosyltransferase involved in cell wall biosynthesis
VDHTLVVVEEALEVVRRGGGAVERTTIVSNTPRLEELSHVPPLGGELIARMRQRFSIVYAGGIRLERGLMLVLEALGRVVAEMPDVLFVAIGSGNALAQLEQATRDKGLRDHVVWLGWAEHREMLGYIREARVGIIPNVVSGHTNTTIPNKIFDYMALGVPVVASNAIPMKRIVDETGCGLTFRGGDPADLARALTSIRAASIDHGSNGARAVQARYHWGVDEQRLLAVVERFKPT